MELPLRFTGFSGAFSHEQNVHASSPVFEAQNREETRMASVPKTARMRYNNLW
jgi:hypothetical protein